MLTKKSSLLLGLTAAVPLLFAACTDNSIFNPMADASGTYQLTVYAGRTLPATFTIQPGDPNYPQAPNGGTLAVTGGNLVLSSNGTFVETNLRQSPNICWCFALDGVSWASNHAWADATICLAAP